MDVRLRSTVSAIKHDNRLRQTCCSKAVVKVLCRGYDFLLGSRSNLMMKKIRTPCIGICSTTSVGDVVCRGCKRYSFEVIDWNSYSDAEKLAVLRRVEKLNVQILEHRLKVLSADKLKAGLRRCKVPFDEALSPYCWVHNLLKRSHDQIGSLEEFGVAINSDFQHLTVEELYRQVEKEILTLCEAHFARYLAPADRQAAKAG